ncbi:IclR family transcriptional regulator [Prescottella equi]|uniref:IclR family transcriptional regulator n=1 Tax=Rhodococcus hoagii TaxID=43767 RepID=UPI000A106251|nr:IclR family transcriptional regulator [Prescottella equi]ORL72477.1 IclR family transcriptional regulator [Prescottella equi]
MARVDPAESTAATRPRRRVAPSMIERMTLIMDVFEDRSTRLTLEEVGIRAGLPRSTVHRILDQLIGLEWVEHASFGYCLGRRARRFGGSVDGEIRVAAAPSLHELHMQTGMVVHLSVLDGADGVYLDKRGGRFASSLPSCVGGRGAAYATAGGKAMLAWLDPRRVDELYGEGLARRTDRTITDIATLHQELNRIRRRGGVAFEQGESVRGVACVGAAVRGVAGPVAAISLCGDARGSNLERVAPLVVDAVAEVSRILDPEFGDGRRNRRVTGTRVDTWSADALDRLVSIQTGRWV